MNFKSIGDKDVIKALECESQSVNDILNNMDIDLPFEMNSEETIERIYQLYMDSKKLAQLFINKRNNEHYYINCKVQEKIDLKLKHVSYDIIIQCYYYYMKLRNFEEKSVNDEVLVEKEKDDADGENWTCNICDYVNNGDKRVCEVCQEEKPTNKSKMEINNRLRTENNRSIEEDKGLMLEDSNRNENANVLNECSIRGKMMGGNTEIEGFDSNENYNSKDNGRCLESREKMEGLKVSDLEKKINSIHKESENATLSPDETDGIKHKINSVHKESENATLSPDETVGIKNKMRNTSVCTQDRANDCIEENDMDNSQPKQIDEELNLDNCETSSDKYNEEESNGDCVNNNVWKCMSCNIDNLISNNVCVACGVNKDGNVDVPESHVMWRCTKCGIDNLLSNRTCVGCDAIDPNIDKWVCEQCSFVNEKCAVECSVCGTKNNNFVKCTMCSKASVFVWDGTVCEDCLKKLQNSEKCENCKQIVEVGSLCKSDVCVKERKRKIRICAECDNAPVSRGSLLSGLCNECLVVKKLCRCCYKKIAESDRILCYGCGIQKWVCGNDKCGAVNDNVKFFCALCGVRNTTRRYISDGGRKCRKCGIYVTNSSLLCVNCRNDKCGQVRDAGRKCGYSDCGKINSALSMDTQSDFCKRQFGTENMDKCKYFNCQQYIERGSTLCSKCSKKWYVCSNDECGQVNLIIINDKYCYKCGQVKDAGRKCGYSDCGKINSALSSDTQCDFCKRPFGTENMDKCKVDWCQQYIERGSTLCSKCSKIKYVCSNDKCGQVIFISKFNKYCKNCGQVKDAGRKCGYSDCGKINSALSSDTQCDFCKRPFPVYTLNNKSNKPIN